jgi:predicted nucleic acid-binding protein
MTEHYVIDPSALIQAYVREPQTEALLALLDQVPDGIELHIPEFCLVECANVLWKHARLHGMPVEAAQKAVENLSEIVMTIHPAPSYLLDALSVGLLHDLAVYDALYIAMAQKLQVPLITADARQRDVAALAGVPLKAITDFIPAN